MYLFYHEKIIIMGISCNNRIADQNHNESILAPGSETKVKRCK
jgi:hypothetical protein